jgi:hypothetical protein
MVMSPTLTVGYSIALQLEHLCYVKAIRRSDNENHRIATLNSDKEGRNNARQSQQSLSTSGSSKKQKYSIAETTDVMPVRKRDTVIHAIVIEDDDEDDVPLLPSPRRTRRSVGTIMNRKAMKDYAASNFLPRRISLAV